MASGQKPHFRDQTVSAINRGPLVHARRLIWVEGGLDQKPENTKAQQALTQKLWDFVGTSNACIPIKSLSQISHFPSQSYASKLPSDYFHF